MTDDSLQDTTGLRTLPTDEINYMRNAVKATVDAYDGTVKLYAWDESDPILKAWRSAFPGTVQPKEDIPAALLEHLRYPEDLFKVQRYQFARYHVTDSGDFYEGNNRWEVPEDPDVNGHLQPPYRLFVDQPTETGGVAQHVLADVGVHAVPEEQPGRVRLGRLRRHVADVRPDAGPAAAGHDDPGPGPDRQRVRLEQRRARRAAQVPVRRRPAALRQPADDPGRRRPDLRRAGVRRACRVDVRLPDPAVRARVVRGRGGDRLDPARRARGRARRRTPPRPRRRTPATATATARATPAASPTRSAPSCRRPRTRSTAADQAFRDGDTTTWAAKTAEGRELVAEAFELASRQQARADSPS